MSDQSEKIEENLSSKDTKFELEEPENAIKKKKNKKKKKKKVNYDIVKEKYSLYYDITPDVLLAINIP